MLLRNPSKHANPGLEFSLLLRYAPFTARNWYLGRVYVKTHTISCVLINENDTSATYCVDTLL